MTAQPTKNKIVQTLRSCRESNMCASIRVGSGRSNSPAGSTGSESTRVQTLSTLFLSQAERARSANGLSLMQLNKGETIAS
eukprot:7638260-Alexandrium_andersonii.AAC.1